MGKLGVKLKMRLKVLLEAKGKSSITLPWNYRTALVGLIYEILKKADEGYADWLHCKGFKKGNLSFRLFTFSDLKPNKWELSNDGMILRDPLLTWEIASPDERFISSFIEGVKLKNHLLKIFHNDYEVLDIAQVNSSLFQNQTSSARKFQTISPIAVSLHDRSISKHAIYLSPDDARFTEFLKKNLMTKWEAFNQKPCSDDTLDFEILQVKKKLVPVFNVNVRAWHLKFRMSGSEELIRFAYDVGLGIRNSQGFGMIE